SPGPMCRVDVGGRGARSRPRVALGGGAGGPAKPGGRPPDPVDGDPTRLDRVECEGGWLNTEPALVIFVRSGPDRCHLIGGEAGGRHPTPDSHDPLPRRAPPPPFPPEAARPPLTPPPAP